MSAGGFAFPDPRRPGVTPILVKIGTDALTFDVSKQKGTYAAQAAVVVRVRDAQGHDVEKLSQQYVLSGDAKDVEAARKGEILFYRQPELSPGLYTLETVVFDAIGAKGSARVSTLTVPSSLAGTLGMSSLVIVSRVEKIGSQPAADDRAAPLYVGSLLVYPNVGEPVRKELTPELPFYFALYPAAKRTLSAGVELLKNGQRLAEAPIALAEQTGSRLQHLGELPISALPVGTYELRIHVSDGAERGRALRVFHTAVDALTIDGLSAYGSVLAERLLELVLPDVDPASRLAIDRELADGQVDVAVTIDVPNVERRVAWEAHLERVFDEDTRFRLLQPDQRRQSRFVLIGSGREQRARHDVEIAVAIEIRRRGAMHAWHPCQLMIGERERASVLEPLDPVIRLDDAIVERIPVGEQHVQIAITIQIDHLNS